MRLRQRNLCDVWHSHNGLLMSLAVYSEDPAAHAYLFARPNMQDLYFDKRGTEFPKRKMATPVDDEPEKPAPKVRKPKSDCDAPEPTDTLAAPSEQPDAAGIALEAISRRTAMVRNATVADERMQQQQPTALPAPKAAAPPVSHWQEATDAATGKAYFYNTYVGPIRCQYAAWKCTPTRKCV